MSRCRSGSAARSRSYSAGVRVRVLRVMTLGSSVWSHGLWTRTRSLTARPKIEDSSTWYLWIDRGESPSADGFGDPVLDQGGGDPVEGPVAEERVEVLVQVGQVGGAGGGLEVLVGEPLGLDVVLEGDLAERGVVPGAGEHLCSSRWAARWASRRVEKDPAERLWPSGSRYMPMNRVPCTRLRSTTYAMRVYLPSLEALELLKSVVLPICGRTLPGRRWTGPDGLWSRKGPLTCEFTGIVVGGERNLAALNCLVASLITQRSQVQILPPLQVPAGQRRFPERSGNRLFCRASDRWSRRER